MYWRRNMFGTLVFVLIDIQKPKDELEVQIKVLEEKLSTANTKLYDSKNANLQLKNELKLANKLLQQEIGDNFQLLASSGNSGWRGRAQVICNLQQKNNELKERLKSYDLGEKVSSISGMYKFKVVSLRLCNNDTFAGRLFW